MPLVDLQTYPLWLNVVIFIAAAAVVWVAGTRLSAAADAFAEHTGIGHAFVGALLLGGITSLPEATTTITAVVIDNPQLAINNLLGGVTMQIVVLALADAALRNQSLAQRAGDSVILLQATLLIFVLGITTAGLFLGDVRVFGLSFWTIAIFSSSAFALFLLHAARDRQPWIPKRAARPEQAPQDEGSGQKHWGWALCICSVAIIMAGIVLTQTADALAVQTGMHAGFIGAVTLALATSLPEISTTVAAVRLKQYTMAYSNIFGANLLDLSFLLLADVVYLGGPVLDQGGDFAIGVCLLAIILTAVTLAGLIERRRVVVARVGLDSLLVVVIYLAGLALLYNRK